jgi:hypothetical protein
MGSSDLWPNVYFDVERNSALKGVDVSITETGFRRIRKTLGIEYEIDGGMCADVWKLVKVDQEKLP